MNEEKYQESCQLQNQLRQMQYDEKLSWKQRKRANDLYKELTNYPMWPSVHPNVVRKMVRQVKEAST